MPYFLQIIYADLPFTAEHPKENKNVNFLTYCLVIVFRNRSNNNNNNNNNNNDNNNSQEIWLRLSLLHNGPVGSQLTGVLCAISNLVKCAKITYLYT